MTSPHTTYHLEFTKLWVQAQPAVAAYFSSHLYQPASIDDLVQETALALLNNFANYDQSRNFTAYAIGTARHLLHDYYRREQRTQETPWGNELLDQIQQAHSDLGDELHDMRQALHTCIQGLPPRERNLLNTRYHENQSFDDIAKQHNTTSSTVRSWLSRLRRTLFECAQRRATTAS